MMMKTIGIDTDVLLSFQGVASTLRGHYLRSRAVMKRMAQDFIDGTLQVNWPCLGGLLNEFVLELKENMEWTSEIDHFIDSSEQLTQWRVEKRVKRMDVYMRFLAESVLSELDNQSNTEACVNSIKVADFMSKFFSDVEMERVCWLRHPNS